MARYELRLDRRVRKKDLAKLPAADLRRVVRAIEALADDPRPVGAEKLTGRDAYRIRRGRYRILFEVDDRKRVVTVRKVAHRREAYR